MHHCMWYGRWCRCAHCSRGRNPHTTEHPCNVKEFKIYIGLTEDHLTEVLHSGLKNDGVSETFALRHVNSAGVRIPTRFLKIVPLSYVDRPFPLSINVAVSDVLRLVVVRAVRMGIPSIFLFGSSRWRASTMRPS